MLTIHKFPFEVEDWVNIEFPLGAQILSLDVQRGVPTIWALVDPEQPTYTRCFRLFGTGHPVDKYKTGGFVGTFQLAGGSLVFHLFEAKD